MVTITLSQEQKERLRREGSLEIRDESGRVIAVIDWEDTPDFADELKRRLDESRGNPKVEGKAVLRHLAVLEQEWKRRGPFEAQTAVDIVRQLRAEESE